MSLSTSFRAVSLSTALSGSSRRTYLVGAYTARARATLWLEYQYGVSCDKKPYRPSLLTARQTDTTVNHAQSLQHTSLIAKRRTTHRAPISVASPSSRTARSASS